MTVKIELNPDVERGLSALAKAQGLSLEAYAEKVLRERSIAGLRRDGGNAAKARAFATWARSHRPVGSLTAESLRRENVVRDAR